MSLYDLKIGEKGIIDFVDGKNKLGKRLLALGCTEGTKVEVKRSAPLGDPIVINLRGFDLAIRKRDTKDIMIRRA